MENDTINRIGFWKRLAAYLLDLLVFCIIRTLFLLSLRFANWDEIPTDNTCKFTQDKDTLDNVKLSDRLDPNMLDPFRGNPYTQSLSSFAY